LGSPFSSLADALLSLSEQRLGAAGLGDACWVLLAGMVCWTRYPLPDFDSHSYWPLHEPPLGLEPGVVSAFPAGP